MTENPTLSFKSFFLRSWLFNIALTVTFTVILFVIWNHYTDTTALRTDFLVNLISLPICFTHTILLLIFSLRRFARKHTLAGIAFLAHFFISGTVGYYLYVILALFGWAYTMKGD